MNFSIINEPFIIQASIRFTIQKKTISIHNSNPITQFIRSPDPINATGKTKKSLSKFIKLLTLEHLWPAGLHSNSEILLKFDNYIWSMLHHLSIKHTNE